MHMTRIALLVGMILFAGLTQYGVLYGLDRVLGAFSAGQVVTTIIGTFASVLILTMLVSIASSYWEVTDWMFAIFCLPTLGTVFLYCFARPALIAITRQRSRS